MNFNNNVNANVVSNADTNPPEYLLKGRPKRGRKRKFLAQSRADKKKRMNSNKPYVNTKGEVVEAKQVDESFLCKCTKKCTEVVGLDLRKKFFNQFWTIGTHEGRCAMLVGCVAEMPKKRTYTKSFSKRSVTRTYKIFGQEACKIAFLRTLKINECRIKLALDKQVNADTYADCRGQSSGGNNKFSESKRQEIISHIEKFPKYVSHYCRNQTEAKFLNADLSLAKMFRLYLDGRADPAKLSSYKQMFYENFNLRFKPPRKDTCLR